jgi:hypothetical protein
VQRDPPVPRVAAHHPPPMIPPRSGPCAHGRTRGLPHPTPDSPRIPLSTGPRRRPLRTSRCPACQERRRRC